MARCGARHRRLYLLGLALLAGLLLGTVCRGVERRFDVAVAAYLAAVGAGMVGVGIGVSMGVGVPTAGAHEQLGEGFRVTRSWLGLVAANVVGCNLAFDGPPALTTAAVAVWVLDAVWRAMTIGTRRAPRPRPAA